MNFKNAKIALVFDWMTNRGGAERVNIMLKKMFPTAPIFSSIFNHDIFPEFKESAITTSFIQSLPFSKTHHQYYISLMPYAYELFDLSEFDIVISSSHACAKGIITKPETMHICYCHSPMRYAWDNWHSYISEYKMNPVLKYFGKKMIHKIRMWDRLSSDRVDYFIANSETTKKRIRKYYSKPSVVINPMVDIKKFRISENREEYFLALGRLIPYKKFDLIIQAFNELKLPLKIVGDGNMRKDLEKMAENNIEFLGFVDDKELPELYSNCEALIFPQLEDFGIIPLEAMASGRPVIAYNKGGATKTVIDQKTGIFFDTQDKNSLKNAVKKYLDEKKKFNPEEIRKHAEKFDRKEFEKNFLGFMKEKWDKWQIST
ncbi:MAG: glycosyltransferase [Candidatus Gracilibacteria bacterium]|jgi:glycosyltransferase involved in cell wall biosynthesis